MKQNNLSNGIHFAARHKSQPESQLAIILNPNRTKLGKHESTLESCNDFIKVTCKHVTLIISGHVVQRCGLLSSDISLFTVN